MRKPTGRAAVGPWIGGTVIGLAIAGAFLAGHSYWPGTSTVTTTTTTPVPNGNITTHTAIPGSPLALGENTIADIAQVANDSVVNIDTRSSITVSDYGTPFGGLEFFLGPGMREMPRRLEQKASGTGFIYRADGYILTNNHVVGNAEDIKVTLADKRVFPGKVVGRDKLTDLAIVKIDARDLPVAKLGTSKNLRAGDWVIAIGSPMGLDHTVTLGIISALNRSVSQVNDVQLIQTDAAINHGNSGGPLINLHAEVIGIAQAIRPDAQNIGFAIPIDIAKEIAQQLLEKGSIARAYVGIYMTDVDPKIAQALGLPENTKGVLVARTAPNGPADKAGLMANDLIQKANGKTVTTGKEVQDIVRKLKPGDKLTLLVARDSQVTAIDMKVGDYPETPDARE